MSWLARSLTSSFNDERDDDGDDDDHQNESPRSRGVKEDLSELTKSFTRQLWGVASFLAPPPPTSSTTDSPSSPTPSAAPQNSSSAVPDSPSLINEAIGGGKSHLIAGDSPQVAGIRSDLSEIGGRFKSGISMLSGNKAVSEISRIASSFLPFGSVDEEEFEEVEDGLSAPPVGVTEEVLTFARNISMHPETWLDFPLFADDEDAHEFEMSDAQRDHALTVEHLAPRLAALRIELCPRHMSEGCFWKIYFVLLHSRLSKHDAELLSTPQIVQARSMLQEMQSRTRTGSNRLESPYAEEGSAKLLSQEPHSSKPDYELSSSKDASSELAKGLGMDSESERLSTADELKIVDKSVIDERSFTLNKDVLTQTVPVSNEKFDEDGDDWLEDSAEISGVGQVTPAFVNEEDVSFSDLEDDGDNSCLAASSKGKDASDSSVDGSRGWVQLGESHSDDAIEDTGSSRPSVSSKDRRDGDRPRRTRDSRESNDWLSIDDMDAV
ncbi:hypothetical protein EJ110_NYTH31533 [Nymphaea thermarum]|nr:hypothetical protein EJ110_NYTH31533 [Nymphaea thermarum]